jgi:hypothetical protein
MGYIYNMKNEATVTKERYRRVPVVRPGQKPWGYSEAVASTTPVAVKLNVPQVLPIKKAPVQHSKTSISVSETMTNLNQNQMADAVASGKHRYDLDQAIGMQVILGILFIAVGAYSTIPLGLGFLALTVVMRKFA